MKQTTPEDAIHIAALEYAYWRDAPEPAQNADLVMLQHMGAMGAAANICGALAQGKTAAEFEADLANRGKPIAEWSTSVPSQPETATATETGTLNPEKAAGLE